MMTQKTLLLIPTYNEAGNIGEILDQIFAVDPSYKVLVIDDSSPDGTAAIVEQRQPRYQSLRLLKRTKDRGFANSYLDGLRLALADGSTDVVMMMDADFSHEPAEIPGLLRTLAGDADVVIGSRYARRMRFPEIALWRQLVSSAANRYVQWVLRLPIADCTAGFLAMRTEALRRLNLDTIRTEGYGFLFELKYRFIRAGCHVVEYPVRWPDRHHGASKMSKAIMWEAFKLPWKIRWQRDPTRS